eukprot:12935778-Prorocentrum_lima.AAC.1
MDIHQGVDSRLVDECLTMACQQHIYEKPLTHAVLDALANQYVRMQLREIESQRRQELDGRVWEL